MGVEVQVGMPLAFLAGLVSVLSACVLPLVPGYLAFVTAMTLDEVAAGPPDRARTAAVTHSVLFVAGFIAVFLSLGLVATPLGTGISRSLPWIQRLGGGLLVVYGVALLSGIRRPAVLGTSGSIRALHASGALWTGLAFGAGWTPCIGPVLGSVLLYVSMDETMAQGAVLLGTYATGLSVPFLAAGVGLAWPLAGSRRAARWILPLGRLSGALLILLGIALVSGYFARLTAVLAGLGQLINLEL
jgi:cytochrome c-type biogenesis protein